MKVACIVGACGGLGIELTQACLKKGYTVFAADLRKTELMEKICSENLDRIFYRDLDATNPEDVESFGSWVQSQTTHIDLLINCLGIYTENSKRELEDFDIEQSLKMFNVNALGPLRIVKRLINLILASNEKVVVNISSEAASMAAPTRMTSRYDYGMSKAALNLQTTILQRQYGSKGVKFLLIHPGWLKTEMGFMGNGEPPVDPKDSAEGIVNLANQMQGRIDDWMFFDYNGTPRPW